MHVARRLASLVPLLLLMPAAAAPPGAVDVSFQDPDTLWAVVEIPSEGPAAQAERSRLDADKDGTVNATEVAAGRERIRTSFADRAIGLPLGRVYVDGVEHNATVVRDVEMEGVPGPVDGAPFVFRWHLALGFAAGPGPDHLVEIDTANHTAAGYIRISPTAVTLAAPPGYVINGTGGLPWGATASATHIIMPGVGDGWIRVRFSPAPDPAANSASALTSLAVVALFVALATRSNRHRKIGTRIIQNG